MHTLKKPSLNSLGYIWGPDSSPNSCSWLQFADDAVIVSKSVSDAQMLLVIFVAWCNWSNMSIRLDKCCTFVMMKRNGNMVTDRAGTIHSIRTNSSSPNRCFVCLSWGNIRLRDKKNRIAEENICIKLKHLLTVTSNLQVKPQTKLKIIQLYIHSQLSFEFRIYNFGSTWIEQILIPCASTRFACG